MKPMTNFLIRPLARPGGRRPRWHAGGALILVLSLVGLSGCGGSGDDGGSGGDGPITVGVFLDQTAYLANADGGLLDGVRLAVDAVNADGGVLGRTIQLAVEDTAADPQKSVAAAQKLLTQQGAVALIAGFSSASTGAVAPIAGQQRKPMVVASIPAQDPSWTFSTLPPGKFQIATMVDQLKRDGITAVGILHDPTPYNKGLLAAAKAALTAAGSTLTGAEQHATDAIDLRPQVTKLLSGQPGAILKLSNGPTEIVAAKALAQAGTSIPLLTAQDTVAIAKQAAAAYPHVMMVSAAPQVYSALPADKQTPALKDLMAKYDGTKDPGYVASGWDALHLLAAAIKSAGSTDGAAIQAAMEKNPAYAGAFASYTFADPAHVGITQNPYYLATFTGSTVSLVPGSAGG